MLRFIIWIFFDGSFLNWFNLWRIFLHFLLCFFFFLWFLLLIWLLLLFWSFFNFSFSHLLLIFNLIILWQIITLIFCFSFFIKLLFILLVIDLIFVLKLWFSILWFHRRHVLIWFFLLGQLIIFWRPKEKLNYCFWFRAENFINSKRVSIWK